MDSGFRSIAILMLDISLTAVSNAAAATPQGDQAAQGAAVPPNTVTDLTGELSAMPYDLNQFVGELIAEAPDSSLVWDPSARKVAGYVYSSQDAIVLERLINQSINR